MTNESVIDTEAGFLNAMMELGYYCENEQLTQWYNDRYGFDFKVDAGTSYSEVYKAALHALPQP